MEGGWADRRLSMVGGGGGGGGEGTYPPPHRKRKKETVGRNFNLFHLCFTNEIRGESIHYTCKMEGVGGQVRVHGGRGWGLAPPPPRNLKKEAARGNFNLFHIYFTTFLI